MNKLVQLALVLAGALTGFLLYRRAQVTRRNRFVRRQECDYDEWFARHYGDNARLSKDRVRAVIEALGTVLGVAPTKLNPSDRLDKEFAFGGRYLGDDTFDAVVRLLRKGLGENLTISPDWKTLDDVICALGNRKPH